jgi:uncharacterized membrane protein
MFDRFARILRHRWHDDDAARAFTPAVLQRLGERVAAGERRYSGQLRVCVESALPTSYVWRGASARERAVTLFGKLRVWDTEDNCGVLLYLLVCEHAIEIVADRGIARRVDAAQWQELIAGMRGAFRSGRFEEGMAQAIDRVSDLLATHFPATPGAAQANELPDLPVVG